MHMAQLPEKRSQEAPIAKVQEVWDVVQTATKQKKAIAIAPQEVAEKVCKG